MSRAFTADPSRPIKPPYTVLLWKQAGMMGWRALFVDMIPDVEERIKQLRERGIIEIRLMEASMLSRWCRDTTSIDVDPNAETDLPEEPLYDRTRHE